LKEEAQTNAPATELVKLSFNEILIIIGGLSLMNNSIQSGPLGICSSMKRKQLHRWLICTSSITLLLLITNNIKSVSSLLGQAKPDNSSVTERFEVTLMGLITPDVGWVANDKHLLLTANSGRSWREITPPSPESTTLAGVLFLDTVNGYAITRKSPTDESGYRFNLAITKDGGVSWKFIDLLSSNSSQPDIFSGTAYIDFVDASNGWVLLKLAYGTNFSRGVLLRTSDGGLHWERLPSPPLGEPIRFVTPNDGWMAGGSDRDELYVTRNGGNAWMPVAIVRPDDIEEYRLQSIDPPIFTSPSDGIIKAVKAKAGAKSIIFLTTGDGGQTWTPLTSIPLPEAITSSRVPFSVAQGKIKALFPSYVLEIPSAYGKKINRLDLSTTPKDSSIIAADFKSSNAGWILTSRGSCNKSKTNCYQESRLYSTLDGGQTLTEITPSKNKQSKLQFELERNTETDDLTLDSNLSIRISNNKGLDKCAAATVEEMRVWFRDSPYKDTNIYIGGISRGCRQVNLNASWISQVSSMGWGLIPTWVGPQAPCSNFPHKISNDPSIAYTQGVNEANAASDTAASIGLTGGTIIYYDMEAYNATPSCSSAVRSFLNGWVERMRQKGNKAGVYGSPSNAAADWAVINNPPDAVWIAKWDGRETVWGLTPLSDSLWNNHQRIHQYQGGHNETYGGITFNIDSNIADGPVVGRGSVCQFNVGQGASGSEQTAFKTAYDEAGGQSVLGCADSEIRNDGFTSFKGTKGPFQLFGSGTSAIQYHSNGSKVGQAFAVINPLYDKWRNLKFGSDNPVGYPIGNISGASTSKWGTQLRFQQFEGGALEYILSGANAGKVFEVHGAIYSKWGEKGYANSELGAPMSDESDAHPSGAGTGSKGRLNQFERGQIYWISNSPRGNSQPAFEVHGAIYNTYVSLGGSAHWLGFPTSDEYVDRITGRARSDFEGGYITTLDGTNYQAFRNGGIDIPLVRGWNLISLPLQPSDTGTANVLSSISGKYEHAWAWNPAIQPSGSWERYPRQIGFPTLTSMSAGRGYWIYMSQEGTLRVAGSTPSKTISLVTGWNLVGYNSPTSQSPSSALSSISGKYEHAWAWNPAIQPSGSWERYPRQIGFPTLTSMSAGRGYWIYARQSTPWTLP
jgi:hypothetical protein